MENQLKGVLTAEDSRFHCQVLKKDTSSSIPGVETAIRLLDLAWGRFEDGSLVFRTYSWSEIFQTPIQAIQFVAYDMLDPEYLAKKRTRHLLKYGASFGVAAGVISAMNVGSGSNAVAAMIFLIIMCAAIGTVIGGFWGYVARLFTKPLVRVVLRRKDCADFMLFVETAKFEEVKNLFVQHGLSLTPERLH